MKYLFVLFAFFLICGSLNGQCSGQIFLPNQAAIDHFSTNYGCGIIDGDLIIGTASGQFTDIVDLSGISEITEVSGTLWILHNLITSLEGLNINTVSNDVVICDNYSLIDISDIANINSIGGDLFIMYNELLEACCDLLDFQELTNITLMNNGASCNTISSIEESCLPPPPPTEAPAINVQFVPNLDSCGTGLYCANLQIQGINGASYIGASSILFSYDSNVLSFFGGSENIYADGVVDGSYTSINFDDDQESLNPDCEIENGGVGYTAYAPHSFDGLISGSVLLTLVLYSPTIGSNSVVCPSIEEEWMNVSTICFEVLDPNGNPNLSVQGTQNGPPPIGTNATNFNPDTNNPINKYDNGNFIDLTTPFESLCPGFKLRVDAFLEGPFNAETNAMNTKLYESGLLPLSQPYNIEPWNFNEEVAIENYEVFPSNVVDWVLIELREGLPQSGMVQGTFPVKTKAGILLNNGEIVEANGEPLTFYDLEEGGKYYIALRHRNHLDVLSSTPIVINANMEYDFTKGVSQAYSAEQLKEINGKAMLHAGDLSGEGFIQNTDYDCWIANPAMLNVYSANDANLDGVVQVSDYEKWFVNRAKVGCVEICY